MMQTNKPTTKLIHLNPNGNLIKMNGKVYRYYTRNLTVSLPSIFYAINHGAIVHEVLSDEETIRLTVQNYALDNKRIIRENQIKEEEERRKLEEINASMGKDTENAQNDVSEQNELPESIESDALRSDLDENSDDEDKNNQKKSNKRNSSKKSVEE